MKIGSTHEQLLDVCRVDLVNVRRRWNAPLQAVRVDLTYT